MKKVIIIYGPPGAGKGTQANLLAAKLGFLHFDTGKYLERFVHDPENQKNLIVKKERVLFDAGKLCTPGWVLKIVRKKTAELARSNFGLAFSGSPRTVFEAFGDSKNQGLIEIFEKYYGKKNIIPIALKVAPETSLMRNGGRLVCFTCGTVVLSGNCVGKACPICASPLKRRTLDTPEIIKTRLKEYAERTAPILAGLKKRGYRLNKINGEPLPYAVFKNIIRKIKLS